MKQRLVNCSIKVVGSRGFLIPTDRLNPRFPSGSNFTVKHFLKNQILVKMKGNNQIFSISEDNCPNIVGHTLEAYEALFEEKRKEGLEMIVEVFKKEFSDGLKSSEKKATSKKTPTKGTFLKRMARHLPLKDYLKAEEQKAV